MSHIQLNYEAATIIARSFGLWTSDVAADFLGVDVEHVRYVCERHGYPNDEFIAACLLHFPVRFDDIFVITDDAVMCAA